MTMRACAKLNTCRGLSSCSLRVRGGGGWVLHPFRPGENRGTELQLCDIPSHSAGRKLSYNSNLQGLTPRPEPSTSVLHLQERRDPLKGCVHSLPRCHRAHPRGEDWTVGKEGKTRPCPGTVPGLADQALAE